MNSFFEDNQKLWDDKVDYHIRSAFYDFDNFLKTKNSLKFIELNALGDVKDKSLLHLQCHFGLDSLSWAYRGAKVTGVDFSVKAIQEAQRLSRELEIPATFVQSNIYDLKSTLSRKFDLVISSYGTICWLPDLELWAEIIAYFLKNKGIFFLVDTHPYFYSLDFEKQQIAYPYFNPGEPITQVIEGTYAAPDAPIKNTAHEWSHSLSEVFMALRKQGLEVVDFQEYPFEVYGWFSGAVKDSDDRWYLKGLEHLIPLLFSIKARKP
ncbi:MAG: class I SAM-dependent methyltransferase [Microscillaceae bacterium]|nr:class I SAM-dependent methyltransferase [Microscillaceae bacterium]